MKNSKENTSQEKRSLGVEWWVSLSPGERKLICSLMEMLRCAKSSQLRDVARAATEWERGIGCFIKVRLMNGFSATGKKKAKHKKISILIEPAAGQLN